MKHEDKFLNLYKVWSKNPDIQVADVLDYSISPNMDADHVRDLYKSRYETYQQRTGIKSIAYEELLHNLMDYNMVTLHTLQLINGTYFIVTDDNVSKVLGVLGTTSP